MDHALAALMAAALVFVASHFALSHPLRAVVIRVLGDRGFQAVYSLAALLSFAWMVIAFRAVGSTSSLWNGYSDTAWTLASLIMLPATVLLVGSFRGNPALPAPGAAKMAARGPHGVFHVTRHPMMWSIALWSAAHVLVSPTPRVLVLAGSLALLALAGAHFQDRKKEVLMGAAWQGWERKTSFVPQPAGFARAGAFAWAGGIAFWLAATWAHVWLAGIPAGPWRWLA